ncbi:MAG: hypothetical protein ACK4WH_08695 [Phycisphaerales bacterium]
MRNLKAGRMGRAGMVLAASAATLGVWGCQQADFSADLHNKTAGPVFAQLMVKGRGANDPATLGASKRLGPGDRAFVGPVRTVANAGAVFLSVDSLPNRSRPATMDLMPGTSFVEVFEDDGMIRVMPKP